MIQLEHINLVVKNIPEMLKFYQTAFPHWYVRDEGEGTWSGKHRNWLHFGDEYQYIAMSDHGEGENRDLGGHQVGLAHFAYVTNNVDAIIKRLTDAGYPIAQPGLMSHTARMCILLTLQVLRSNLLNTWRMIQNFVI